MDVSDALDEIEETLEQVDSLLAEGEFAAARDEATTIAGTLDCPLCENLENGIIGGIMFAATMTPDGRDRRAEYVRDEIGRFIEVELAAAREQVENDEHVTIPEP